MTTRLQRLSLGSRITALTAGAAVLLSMIAVTAALTATSTRADTVHLTERISPAYAAADRLLALALAQQTGATQYTASGLDYYKNTLYTRAHEQEIALARDVEKWLENERALLGQFQAIRRDLDSWRSEIAEPLINAVAVDGPDPERGALPQAVQTRFSGILQAIARFKSNVTTVRDELRDQVQNSSNLLVWLLFSAAVVVIATGILLAMLLSRLVTRPVIELAAEVRQVAEGDYEHEISGGGPPELENLARDVNAMRQKIAADLTEVRLARSKIEEANRLLEQQTEELTRSNRDLEQFAYVASHDLQEPLRKVASFCQLLQRRYAGQLDERADQYIYFAVDGAQRMQRLINDLLAFSRIGRMTTGFVDVDLNRVVDDIIGQREPTSGKITRGDLPVVNGEEPLLSALLTNLIGNSVKFRKPDVPIKIHVDAERRDDEWELSVRDNGIGIGAEFVDKVFVIFQRLHSKEAYPGTGIGLAISKKIIEYHGGRIWVDTAYEDGTLIRFTLPVREPAVSVPVGPELSADDHPVPALSRAEEPAQ
ncbi:sensor histidine kinase [Virgisporangium aurantiacum]|uniref:histidine kinase n=1 Tax=Virgisporangium aurantiacum TaxID=175570 RepID=A0A8J4DYQ7_9ACTN|nr:ATP-binding protein [Virgisporangium aurantiacum]GIJ53292.1 histidine kinase [Virgisporangium aurantiacum]